MSLFRCDSPHVSSIGETLLKRALCPCWLHILTFLLIPKTNKKNPKTKTVAVILLADPSLPEWMRNSVLYLSSSLSCIRLAALETLSPSGISDTASFSLSDALPPHELLFQRHIGRLFFLSQTLLEGQPGLSPLPSRSTFTLISTHPYAVLQRRLSSTCWWLSNPYL